MSLSSELEVLSKRVQDLKKEVRSALLRSLGVDRLVKCAFEEGWQMARELDPGVLNKAEHESFYERMACWRSVDEAFANSDVEEEV